MLLSHPAHPCLPSHPHPPARPHLRVAVFERSSLRPRGAALAVQPNGIAALAAIAPSLADRVLALDRPQGPSGSGAARRAPC